MASTYSVLKIELIGTGDQSGLWGGTTNINLGTALEEAIVGRATANFTTDADLTITLVDVNTTQVARNYILNVTSSVPLTASRNLIVPTINKPYIIENNTSGGQSIVVKTAAGTGITVPNGKRTMVYANSTNVVAAENYIPDLTLGAALPVTSGGTGITSFGTGIATALGINVGTAGAPVVNGGVLGTPSSGTLTNATGLPIVAGTTGTLTVLRGGTGTTTSTGTGSVVLNGGIPSFSSNITVSGIPVGKAGSPTGFFSSIAIGVSSLLNNSTGTRNISLGTLTMGTNTTGSDNVGLGYQAMYLNTTGSYNVALGYAAMAQSITGSNNTAIGPSTLLFNGAGINNTAVGGGALYAYTKGVNPLLTTGDYNSALGVNALYANAGDYNIGLGYQAGKEITTGSYNVVVGSYDGNSGGLDIRTSNNNIVLSDGQGNIRMRIAQSGGVSIGNTTDPGAANLNVSGVINGGYSALAAGTTAMAFGGDNVVRVTPNADATYTTTVPGAGAICVLSILTSGTTSYTITFGSGFKSTGTLVTGTVTARYFNITFVSDGTNLIETARTVAIA
jgi:hypothetical protein